MLPFTPADAKAIISDPTASICGNFVATLLKLPVLFYELVNELFDESGNAKTIPVAGDLVYSFASLASNTHRLRCDGAAYSTTIHAVLYAAIGNVYDTMADANGAAQSAPGAGFFRVPICGARFPLATGSLPVGGAVALGGTGGEEQHVLLETELPAHHHTTTLHRSSPDTGPDNLFATGNGPDDGGDYPDQDYDTNDVGSDTPHNTIPPYFAAHCYIITGI